MGDEPVKILIADNDPEDIELIEEYLLMEAPDLQLSKFKDGLSVSEYLKTLPDEELPSLIILDYNMPGLTGAQVLSSLRSAGRYKSIPKIVLSTSDTPKFIQESLQNGASEYIVKPGSMREIQNLAKKFVSLAAGSR
jgi:CheY-like chemotaxis protein